jgi:hypothetical protein
MPGPDWHGDLYSQCLRIAVTRPIPDAAACMSLLLSIDLRCISRMIMVIVLRLWAVHEAIVHVFKGLVRFRLELRSCFLTPLARMCLYQSGSR